MARDYSAFSMDDIVFENRNKAFGAYALRRDYNKSLGTAILIIVSFITVLCFGNYFREKWQKPEHAKKIIDVVAITQDVQTHVEQQKRKEVLPPKPPKEVKQAAPVATAENVEKKVVENSKAVDTILPNKALADLESGLKTNTNVTPGIGATDGKGTAKVLETAKEIKPQVPAVVSWADHMPEFPGGEKALLAYMADNTPYPDMERDNGIIGKVTAQFTVNEDGSISDIQIVRTPSAGFNKVVTKAIAKMPRFKPGMQNGQPVRVRYTLPVSFNLK